MKILILNCDLSLGLGYNGHLYKRDFRGLKLIKIIKNFSKLDLNENDHSRSSLSLGFSKKGNAHHPLYMSNESFLKPFGK